MTQPEVHQRFKVSVPVQTSLENNRGPRRKNLTITRLATAYGVDPNELVARYEASLASPVTFGAIIEKVKGIRSELLDADLALSADDEATEAIGAVNEALGEIDQVLDLLRMKKKQVRFDRDDIAGRIGPNIHVGTDELEKRKLKAAAKDGHRREEEKKRNRGK